MGATLEGKEFQKKQEDARKDLAKLQEKQGQEFDKAFMKHMVKDHEKDVKEFEEASKKAEDSDVKAFAAKTLTTLQEHLDTAKATRGKLAK